MPKGHFIPLTPEDEAKIRREYLRKPIKTIAKEIGTTHGTIMRRLDKWGLEIPQSLKKQRKQRGMFRKGHEPANKGKKQTEYMSPEKIKKTAKTRFKKGNIPHNTKFNGAIVTRNDSRGIPYKFIRISKGNWHHLHRHIWEKANPKIKKDEILMFVDGDTMNCNIENLKLISREENMLRNSMHDIPEEIIPSMALVAQINNKINSLTDDKE